MNERAQPCRETSAIDPPARAPKAPWGDRLLAGVGLILLAPVFALIALLIQLESRGPCFYRQVRIGKDGRPFLLYKFRKMRHGPDLGPKISPRNDLRLTRIGKFLERFKLDELPQLINVVRGEMRIVGSRPEIPEIVAMYTPAQRRVLEAWPGITGPNQILWRNEKELIPSDVDDVEDYYIHFILPKKLATDLAYLQRRTAWTDLKLLARTAWVTLFEPLKLKHLSSKLNFLAHLATDALLVELAAVFSAFLLTGTHVIAEATRPLLTVALLLGGIHYLGFLISGVCQQSWRLVAKTDLLALATSLLFTSLAGVPLVFLTLPWLEGVRLLLLSFAWTLLLNGGARFALAIQEERKHASRAKSAGFANVVLYGVNRECELFLRRVELNLEPGLRVIGLLDSDPRKRGMRVRNAKILGTAADLPLLHELRAVDVVYSFAEKEDRGLVQLRRLCDKLGIPLRQGFSWRVISEGEPMSSAERCRPSGPVQRPAKSTMESEG
jgi:lipopolysaccharide/colanic/teichoic acid biosynthesis glycosyltransferase